MGQYQKHNLSKKIYRVIELQKTVSYLPLQDSVKGNNNNNKQSLTNPIAIF